jgi:hypothetical protein
MRYCSVFGIPRVLEFSSFYKRLFVFISGLTIDPALDKGAMVKDVMQFELKYSQKISGTNN